MRFRMAVVLLLLLVSAALMWAQGEATSDTVVEETVEESDSATVTTTTVDPPVVWWIHLVRLAAVAGPVAFLLLAWAVGAVVHYRLVRREQQLFPAVRGSRTPQTIPMILSATLFFVPALLFVVFEVRSRQELSRGIGGGILEQWQPVMGQAWITLVVCLVFAIVPWLFARRADTVA